MRSITVFGAYGHTGKFVVASDGAVIEGVEVGRYLQTYSKKDIGPPPPSPDSAAA